jgi:hypothetical protein
VAGNLEWRLLGTTAIAADRTTIMLGRKEAMPSNSDAIAGIERRMSNRRTETERRDLGRADTDPRRSQLRRKTDVVNYLGAPRAKGSGSSDAAPLRRLPKRPLKGWIEKGLGRESNGRLFG